MNDCRPLCVFTGQSLPFPFVHLCSKETAILMSTLHILLPLPLGCEMYWWKQHILWFRSSEKQLRKVAIQRTVQLSPRVPAGGEGEAQGKCRPGEPRTLSWGGCWGCIRDCKTCGHRGTMAGLSLITLEETKEHFWGRYERPQWLQWLQGKLGRAVHAQRAVKWNTSLHVFLWALSCPCLTGQYLSHGRLLRSVPSCSELLSGRPHSSFLGRH